jgi:hypothetical protein
MLIAIGLGLLLAVVTIAIHAVGTSTIIRLLQSHSESYNSRIGELKALTFAAVGLLVTHIVETVVWALAYSMAVGGPTFSKLEDAVYFSTVTFTTLGYGDIVIEGDWRMLCACQAMTGLLVFGWSTALLFAVVERVWKHRFGDSNES